MTKLVFLQNKLNVYLPDICDAFYSISSANGVHSVVMKFTQLSSHDRLWNWSCDGGHSICGKMVAPVMGVGCGCPSSFFDSWSMTLIPYLVDAVTGFGLMLTDI